MIEEGKIQAAGLEAFNKRSEQKAGIYSFEQDSHKLVPSFEKKLKANKKALKFFTSKAPWYQRTSIHWVISAKQEATQLKRLEKLFSDSENERTIALLTRTPKK